jgi:hypothetical protein
MDDTDFEGTLVLEQLAAIDKIEDFFEAIDADDVERAGAAARPARRSRETAIELRPRRFHVRCQRLSSLESKSRPLVAAARTDGNFLTESRGTG